MARSRRSELEPDEPEETGAESEPDHRVGILDPLPHAADIAKTLKDQAANIAARARRLEREEAKRKRKEERLLDLQLAEAEGANRRPRTGGRKKPGPDPKEISKILFDQAYDLIKAGCSIKEAETRVGISNRQANKIYHVVHRSAGYRVEPGSAPGSVRIREL